MAALSVLGQKNLSVHVRTYLSVPHKKWWEFLCRVLSLVDPTQFSSQIHVLQKKFIKEMKYGTDFPK